MRANMINFGGSSVIERSIQTHNIFLDILDM